MLIYRLHFGKCYCLYFRMRSKLHVKLIGRDRGFFYKQFNKIFFESKKKISPKKESGFCSRQKTGVELI